MSAFLVEVTETGAIIFSGFITPNHTNDNIREQMPQDHSIHVKLDVLSKLFEQISAKERMKDDTTPV